MTVLAFVLPKPQENGECAATGAARVPARGWFRDGLGRQGSFVGTYVQHAFGRQYGQLTAAGVVAGRLCDSNGADLGATSRRVTVAATATTTGAGVEIGIGPIDVSLSGLMTHLEPLALHLVPDSEWGKLCDRLLSAISAPLERPISGARVVALLNALLTIVDPPDTRPAPLQPR